MSITAAHQNESFIDYHHKQSRSLNQFNKTSTDTQCHAAGSLVKFIDSDDNDKTNLSCGNVLEEDKDNNSR